MPKKNEQNEPPNSDRELRSRLNQSDIPAFSLEKALAVARAIGDNYAYKPASPLDVASALGVIPTTGGFRMLTGASVAWGLTAGGYSANEISITPLGMRVVRPLSEDGDDAQAKREAALIPKLVGSFLKKYDGNALPKPEIAQNVLQSMGIPLERTRDAYVMIMETAKSVGFLRDINGRVFVDLKGTPSTPAATAEVSSHEEEAADFSIPETAVANFVPAPSATPSVVDDGKAARKKRVFITHGKSHDLIEPIQKLLKFGDLEPVVSVQSQTASVPVPDKIMNEMRSCGAAIIHVTGERNITDTAGNEHVILNDNVLIEIGAAMALFGSRFILVVKDGVKLPSNLQGLLELRYKGDTLDVGDTVKLLDAIADMKGRSLP